MMSMQKEILDPNSKRDYGTESVKGLLLGGGDSTAKNINEYLLPPPQDDESQSDSYQTTIKMLETESETEIDLVVWGLTYPQMISLDHYLKGKTTVEKKGYIDTYSSTEEDI